MIERRLCTNTTPFGQISIILLVGFAVYFNTLFNGFVYDDYYQVLRNPWIHDIKYIPDIFTANVWEFRGGNDTSYYRPLMHIIYLLNQHLFGLSPWGFHLVNILFHAGISVLVFVIASRLLGESLPSTSFQSHMPPPFVAAMIFAVHPIHTEAVAWVAGVPELSFTFFYLLSFYFYILSGNNLKGTRLSSVVAFSLATLCKEMALTLPGILLAYDYAFTKGKALGLDNLKKYSPYLVVAGVYLAIRYFALGGLAPVKKHGELSTYQYFINIFPLFVQYLEKLLFPVNLNAFHVFHPIDSILERKGVLSLLVTAAFVFITRIAIRKNKRIFFSLILMTVPLIPVFYLPGLGENAFAERYLYLPSFGFAMLVALCPVRTRSKAVGTVTVAVLLLVTVIFAIGTVRRNIVWRNDYNLWSDTVGKSPDGAVPHYNLGTVLFSQGKIDESTEHYKIALGLQPTSSGYNDLGLNFKAKGWNDKAIEQYQTAIKLQPDNADAHFNLGLAYKEKGLMVFAIEHFQIAANIQPDDAEIHYNLGQTYRENGLMDEAIEHFVTALRLNPNNATFRAELARTYELKSFKGNAGNK